MRSWLSLGLVLALAGCVERQPDLSPAERQELTQYVSNRAPTPQHPLDVQFDNGLRLIGYDAEPATATPGQPITLTWWWHATQDLDDGWMLFTHVADANGENRLNQDGVGKVREIYQPGRWQAGQYIKDVQRVTIPADWNSTSAVFYLGLWNDPHRLAIRRGPNDGDNRVRAATIEVSSAPSAAADPERAAPTVQPPPTLNVPRSSGPIAIDGQLNEAAWNSAARTARFVHTTDGSNAELQANARVLWDAQNLYVAFEVADDFLSNDITQRDGHLWTQDAVEIMLDPSGRGTNYVEMQVSPTGAMFDTRYRSRRQPQPFGDLAYDARMQARVATRGTVNDDSPDLGYTTEIAIPWASLAAERTPAPNAQAGTSLRMNLYVMDKRPGDAPQRTAGWSPTHEGDFHVPARFGRLVLQEGSEAVAVAEPTPAPAAQPNEVQRLQLSPAALQALRERMPNPVMIRAREQLENAQRAQAAP